MPRSLSLLFSVVVLFSATSANAVVLELSWSDPTADFANLNIDLIGMDLTFDNTTGDYELVADFDPANPFSNPFSDFLIINVNMFNTTNPNGITTVTPFGLVSLPNFPSVTAPTTQLIFTGTHSGFTSWNAGDAISNDSTIATPGVTFRSGIQRGGQGIDRLAPVLSVVAPAVGAPSPIPDRSPRRWA